MRPKKSKSHCSTIDSPLSEKLVDFISKCKKKNVVKRKAVENEKHVNRNIAPQKSKRRRRKPKKATKNVEIDGAARLQRRARYLLIKMKHEQNLLDAYSAEGWKGQSREKIRPERELQRARKEILKCKLGIRDALRQLDLLSSVGCIEESAIDPDGSVHHEHIHCAKCKLREAFPDNDIILCDGTCNCAFHQKCIDPPLLTENIPPGDQGWFCKFCVCKMDIVEAMNAHIGTSFFADTNWQDIFKEEANLPDGGNTLLHPENEWPSDDSEDGDYDPEGPKHCDNSRSGPSSESGSSDDDSTASSLWSLEDEVFNELESSKRIKLAPESMAGADSDDITDCEVMNGRRQRRAVDYKKLHYEMFGKDAFAYEQVSEDEDWGPNKRTRRGKESNAASTTMTPSETEKEVREGGPTKVKARSLRREGRRPIFRFPADAVEKLRLVFAEDELPSRDVRKNLSEELGLDFEKVNKWFKNSRYLALKTRKMGNEKTFENNSPKILKETGDETVKDTADELVQKDLPPKGNSASIKKRIRGEKNPQILARPSEKQKHQSYSLLLPECNKRADAELGDDVSLKTLRETAKRKKSRTVCSDRARGEQRAAEAEMERLCSMKDKLQMLQQVLQGLPSHASGTKGVHSSNQPPVVCVPVAVVIEKT